MEANNNNKVEVRNKEALIMEMNKALLRPQLSRLKALEDMEADEDFARLAPSKLLSSIRLRTDIFVIIILISSTSSA